MNIVLALFFLFLICTGIVFIRWDYLSAAKHQKAFAEKKPELLAIVRAHMETETKDQLVERIMRIVNILPNQDLENFCKNILTYKSNTSSIKP